MSGFVYIWFDRKHKRYYIGSHWGSFNDGYICSSNWMRDAYRKRPNDFKRRIIAIITTNRRDLLTEEERWLSMIKPEEIRRRYYNLRRTSVWHWLSDEQKALSIREKISSTKTGVKAGPCPPEKRKAISEAKRRKFQERLEKNGQYYDNETLNRMKEGTVAVNKGRKHTEEWKQQNSTRLKEQWDNGTRKRAEPKQTMSREEQDKLCSQQLKSRWNDPVWRANQIARLKECSKRRHSAKYSFMT